MMGSVPSQGLHVDVRQVILRADRRIVQNVFDSLLLARMRGEVERFRGDVFPEGNYVDALAVLRYSAIFGVEYFVKRDIALFPKGAEDGLKGPSAIVDG